MKKKLLILCILMVSMQVVAQEANEQEMRPATPEELEYLVPEIMEKVNQAPGRVVVTKEDNQKMQVISGLKINGNLIQGDVENFFQKKVNQGADKDVVINFANMLNSTYMSMLSKDVKLEAETIKAIQFEKTQLEKQKELIKVDLEAKIDAEEKRLLPELSNARAKFNKLQDNLKKLTDEYKKIDREAPNLKEKLYDIGYRLALIEAELKKIDDYIIRLMLEDSGKAKALEKLAEFEKQQSKIAEQKITEATNIFEQRSKKLINESSSYKNIINKGREFQKEIESIVANLDYDKKGIEPIEYDMVQKLNVGLLVPKDFSIEDSIQNEESCGVKPFELPIENIAQTNNELIDIAQADGKKSTGRLYFFWGYNRAFHSKSDVTFKTSEGEFTIIDAHGDDRPSRIEKLEDFLTYIRPADITIPQFNFRIGYMFNDTWGIEAGTDHMKWIFDNKRQYEITGEFSPTVYVENPNAQHGWDGVMPVDFDYVKEHGDASWLAFEHSDGYNYVHLSAVFNKNLYTGKKGKFAINAGGTLGGGAMIPKTKVVMHRDQAWNWTGLDNRFHLAGYGGHSELSLSFKFFDRFALKGSARGTAIKIDNALVYTDRDPNARLSHTPIYSFQYNVGLEIDLWKKKKRR